MLEVKSEQQVIFLFNETWNAPLRIVKKTKRQLCAKDSEVGVKVSTKVLSVLFILTFR